MNVIYILGLCFLVCLGDAQARMSEFSKMLGLSEKKEDDPLEDGLNEDLRTDPDTSFANSNFDINKYLSQSNAIETARKNLGVGDIQQYMPAPIQIVECHVEFQVTERVPGRCTKLAGTIPACQAEKYIGINYSECN